jgi:hypothetical protein
MNIDTQVKILWKDAWRKKKIFVPLQPRTTPTNTANENDKTTKEGAGIRFWRFENRTSW